MWGSGAKVVASRPKGEKQKEGSCVRTRHYWINHNHQSAEGCIPIIQSKSKVWDMRRVESRIRWLPVPTTWFTQTGPSFPARWSNGRVGKAGAWVTQPLQDSNLQYCLSTSVPQFDVRSLASPTYTYGSPGFPTQDYWSYDLAFRDKKKSSFFRGLESIPVIFQASSEIV